MNTRSNEEYGNSNTNNVNTEITDPNISTRTNLDASTILCRYFNSGGCRFGSNCRFAHTPVSLSVNDLINHSTPQNMNFNSSIGTNSDVTDTTTESNSINSSSHLLLNWVDAPEFVPGNFSKSTTQIECDLNVPPASISYAQIVSGNPSNSTNFLAFTDGNNQPSIQVNESTLCPYINRIIRGDAIYCPYGESCIYDHGELCDMCHQYCLHPTNEAQRAAHQTECLRLLEKDMEVSFALAKSKDKTCGICFEVITEKVHREHRFGILPNCNHIFCLQCIRKWRQAKNFDSTITRACPECRVTSNYVCPSLYWVDTKEEKDKLLTAYKEALGQQHCKYFNKGQGRCPFGNKCFYKHALPNGDLVDLGIPQQRRRLDLNGDIESYQQPLLWNFLEARDAISSDDDYDYHSYVSNNSDLEIVHSEI